jgi:hypothetical protein
MNKNIIGLFIVLILVVIAIDQWMPKNIPMKNVEQVKNVEQEIPNYPCTIDTKTEYYNDNFERSYVTADTLLPMVDQDLWTNCGWLNDCDQNAHEINCKEGQHPPDALFKCVSFIKNYIQTGGSQ